jgi:hypothetical protein
VPSVKKNEKTTKKTTWPHAARRTSAQIPDASGNLETLAFDQRMFCNYGLWQVRSQKQN